MRLFFVFFISSIFTLPILFTSCKKNAEAPNYLNVKKTISYDNYTGGFENLWVNNGFLFAHISYGNILKLVFDGNILDSISNINTNEVLIIHNQNRLECFHNFSSLTYKYYDKGNLMIQTGTINLTDETVQRHKLVTFQERALWVILVANIYDDKQRFLIVEIDSNGIIINEKTIKSPFAIMHPFAYLISSQNQLSIIMTVFNNSYHPGTGMITLNNNLDTLWSKSIIDTNYNIQFVGATYFKNNDIGIVYNRDGLNVNSIRQYLITEDGNSYYDNKFEVSRSLRNIFFLSEKNNSIGFGNYGYNLSSSLLKLSKTGEYNKTLVKETGILEARAFIENGDYYYLAGGIDFYDSNPVLTIVEK